MSKTMTLADAVKIATKHTLKQCKGLGILNVQHEPVHGTLANTHAIVSSVYEQRTTAHVSAGTWFHAAFLRKLNDLVLDNHLPLFVGFQPSSGRVENVDDVRRVTFTTAVRSITVIGDHDRLRKFFPLLPVVGLPVAPHARKVGST